MKLIITESFFDFLTEATSEEIHAKYYSGIPIDIFNQLISSDPTTVNNKMGKYSKWILNLYNKKMLKLEDLYKVKEYLEYYHKFINKIQEKDINKIASLPDLYTIISPFQSDPNQSSSKSDETRKIKEDAEKVFEDSDWLVIVPKTKEASCYYGKNTQWCTAASNNNMFDEYNKEGKLYININKKTNKKYQFNFETSSFMDERDTDIKKPISESINMSDGLIEFYKTNIQPGFFARFFYKEFKPVTENGQTSNNRRVGIIEKFSEVLLDENYERISKIYTHIYEFIDGISVITDIQNNEGLMNINGDELIKPNYQEVEYGRGGSDYIGLNSVNSYSVYDKNSNKIVVTLDNKIYYAHVIKDNLYPCIEVGDSFLFAIFNIKERKFKSDFIFNGLPYSGKGPKKCMVYDPKTHEHIGYAEVQQNGDYKIVEE